MAIVLLLEAQFDMELAKMKSPEIINFLPNQFFYIFTKFQSWFIVSILRFQNWFDVDVLEFVIEL